MTHIKAEDLPQEVQERLGIARLIEGTAPSPGIRYKRLKRPNQGSPFHLREEQTLILAKEGYCYKEIAQALGVTVPSVKTYASRAIARAGGTTMLDAVILSLKKGYIGLYDTVIIHKSQ
ncbi:hypothetical protein LCGC14_2093580 [marine sediment metagenome]|uniref:HTH luxR-type domain-containing protein n=1 Tax=marine sediment metagenome TaxID=412755 RepID=A0A0F9H8U6_9ZZZZ